MEVLNKILPFILTAIMSINLSGCGNTVANGSQPASTVVSSSEVVYKTIEPPADGWTDDLIYQVSYFCGQPVSLPCKFDDLKLYNELSWSEPQLSKDEKVYICNGKEYTEIYTVDYTYNDLYIGDCGYILENEQKIVIYLRSHRISNYMIEKNKLDQNIVDKLNKVMVINNVYNGISEESLISLLGTNYTKHGNYYNLLYKTANTEMIFMIPDSDSFASVTNNEVDAITIAYKCNFLSEEK